MQHISGNDRNQMQFLCLEEMIAADSWARIIDMFVDILPLQELGFKHTSLQKEGRPPYSPAFLLKLYLYGYKYAIRFVYQTPKDWIDFVELFECFGDAGL